MSDGYHTHTAAWLTELERVMNVGRVSAPRGIMTRERLFRELTVYRPLTFPLHVEGREFADVIGVLEGLSLVGQFSVPELFTDRVRKFGEFMDHGVFHGAYGTRIHGRLGDLVELMERDPDTRQAVLTIFDSKSDLGVAKRDVPCTLNIHFRQRDRELLMKVTMRSNDLWLGTPYDLTQFSILQASVAQALGLQPGPYVHAAGSLHLYERDLAKASAVEADGAVSREMGFPLWGCADDIGAISSRARRLMLEPQFDAVTEFESWAHALVYSS